ncbi:putative cyclin-dependent kinase F-2 [Lolium rigidum]|uniref:putative cyclin-dependent kinase F-2 n=1 Tax=Lolium rigidum TaxID=89674 RepID=UPI001F5CDB20|nr:putative cyclin-dependent kinase F-2 [Lolium rigidum]
MVFCSCKRSATVHATRGSSATITSIGSTADYEYDHDHASSLGKGNFGVVVKARHRATGNAVAIKSLSCTDDDTATDAGQMLLREARFLAEASSGNPHVVGSHGLVLDPDTSNHCLVMEYVGPKNLAEFLSGRPPLPEATVRAFMRQLLAGADTMHKRRIVHRDIKPANVLVGEDEETVKIGDLGLAMSLATERQPYGKTGTASYMAPEVLLGKPDYDGRVDAWSLGCVMAEMLTGGETLFEFKGDDGRQLLSIFSVLGVPDWPGVTSSLLGRQRPDDSRLRELFPVETLSEDGFQVLEGLLACNPRKRLTAAAALKLPWFSASAPRPAAAAKVSTFALLRKKVEAALPVRKGLRAKIIQPEKKTDIPFGSIVTKLVQHIRLVR